MLKFTPIVVLLMAAAPAVAQIPASSPPEVATAPAKVNPLDKMICRTEEGLGSRLNKKKVCMSLREWKDQADDSREATEKIQLGQGVTPSG